VAYDSGARNLFGNTVAALPNASRGVAVLGVMGHREYHEA
jgi:hypothetical protein